VGWRVAVGGTDVAVGGASGMVGAAGNEVDVGAVAASVLAGAGVAVGLGGWQATSSTMTSAKNRCEMLGQDFMSDSSFVEV
jgi:hypothetical protein